MADQSVPPPPRRKVDWLLLIAGASGLATLPLFGLLGGAWSQFDGDWSGPLGLINGRSGKVWIVVAEAWTYLVPLIVALSLAVATTLGCLLTVVVRDGKRASRGREQPAPPDRTPHLIGIDPSRGE